MGNDGNCILYLQDLVFSSFNYELLNKPQKEQELHVGHSIKYYVNGNLVRVELHTNIYCDNFMKLDLITIGHFEINEKAIVSDQDPDSLRKFITVNNTVAIMFPYIRAQVTLLTSQPGFNSVVLPPIDITQMTNNAEIIDETEE